MPSNAPVILAWERTSARSRGSANLGVRLTAIQDVAASVDAMIDFSHPSASLEAGPLLHGEEDPAGRGDDRLRAGSAARSSSGSAATIPLLISPNMSRAVNLLMRLVAEAARALGDTADIEIVERHHRMKKDSPSGTAVRLAEIAAQAAGISRFVHGRHGQVGERPRDEIGIHAVRGGDVPGDHTVVFGLMGEIARIDATGPSTATASSAGAIDAAKFLAGKPPGLYTMSDVLG